MSVQMPDTMQIDNHEYFIVAVDGSGLFDPEDHGFRPEAIGTACWRGYICAYVLRGNSLELDSLVISQSHDRPRITSFLGASAGKKTIPGSGEPNISPREALSDRFSNLDWGVPFGGRLLVARETAPGPRLSSGYSPAWFYAVVHEMIFEDGHLVGTKDQSNEAADVRRRFVDSALRPADGETRAEFRERASSLSFSFSLPNTQ